MTDATCPRCGDDVPAARAALGYRLCLWCGEEEAKAERRSWTVLTPHKQGAMFFTSDFAREAARGINTKQPR
jgi:hypothetical protein